MGALFLSPSGFGKCVIMGGFQIHDLPRKKIRGAPLPWQVSVKKSLHPTMTTKNNIRSESSHDIKTCLRLYGILMIYAPLLSV